MNYKIFIFFFLFIINIKSYSQNYYNDSAMVYIDNGHFYYEKQKIFINEFLISKYEVSNLEYCNFLNNVKLKNDSIHKYINLNNENCKIYFKDSTFYVKNNFENYPVVFVSWFGANAFCKYYNLRLPTETEWEYVALESNRFSLRKFLKNYYIYSGGNNADKVAWYKKNSQNRSHKIGLKKANSIGIYDMSGNVDEWCSNWYSSGKKNNKKGVYKVIKGGSWYNSEKMLRILNTRATNPKSQKATIGFRVVKDIATFCPVK